jgi:hypothetical protein
VKEAFCRGRKYVFLFNYCIFTIYSRYLKRVISKRDGCECKRLHLSMRLLNTIIKGLNINNNNKAKDSLLLLINESLALVREQIIPTERPPLVGEVSAKFADRGCHMFSVTDTYGRIFDFLVRSRYFFFHVAPQLYSRD